MLVAQVTVDFEAFKRSLEILLKASRGSHARIMVEYEAGQLVITRAKSSTTITAVGSWSGKATFYDDKLLLKLPHLRGVDGTLILRVEGERLCIGEWVAPCRWEV